MTPERERVLVRSSCTTSSRHAHRYGINKIAVAATQEKKKTDGREDHQSDM